MAVNPLDPVSPGEILLAEFLEPLGLSQNQLAKALRVPPGRVNDLVHGRRSVTRDTAARLAVYFSTTADFWINLQAGYDAKVVTRELMPNVAKLVRPHQPTARSA